MSDERNGLVLVVDDEPSNIEVIAEALDGCCEVIFATNGLQALELASSAQPDLILLDVMMPGMDGYEVCARLREERGTAAIPIIFVTALGDAGAETRGLELGAVDYIAKPINSAIVKMRVRNQIELKQSRDELVRLAITDGLTGLSNRRHFDSTLQGEYRRLSRSNEMMSVILFDIDFFKSFNDTYGHMAGDDCLRRVAGVVLSVVNRASDVSARYGGEEFACILSSTDITGAMAIAERLRSGISGLGIVHAKSSAASHVTASFGVISVRCAPGRSPLHALALVDEQLYAAKAGGRNCIMAGEAIDMNKFSP